MYIYVQCTKKYIVIPDIQHMVHLYIILLGQMWTTFFYIFISIMHITIEIFLTVEKKGRAMYYVVVFKIFKGKIDPKNMIARSNGDDDGMNLLLQLKRSTSI